MKSTARNLIIIFVLLLVVIAGGWTMFMGQSDNQESTSSTTSTATPVQQPTSNPTSNGDQPITSATGQVRAFTINAQNYTYSTKNMTVNQRDTVRITLKSVGGTHDLVIDEFVGAQTNILAGGQEQTIEFVADKPGSFNFYCSVSDHRAMGMEGTLTVR